MVIHYFHIFCCSAYIWQSWYFFQWCYHWPTSSCELPNVPASWSCFGCNICSSLFWTSAWRGGEGCSAAAATATASECHADRSTAAAQDISRESWPGRQRGWLWSGWCGSQPMVWCSIWTSEAWKTSGLVLAIFNIPSACDIWGHKITNVVFSDVYFYIVQVCGIFCVYCYTC